MRRGRPARHDWIALAVLAAVPALSFLDVILGRRVFYARDVTLYFLPTRHILRAVVAAGEFPYWNPFLLAGQPLAANPAYQVFYPPTWLILLPDFLYAFQWLALAHIFLATFAMYALVRSLGTSRAAAAIGALSYGIGGLIVSTVALLPILYSAAWLPLICLFTRRFLQHRAFRDFALASLCFAMQFLVGEPMTVAQTGFLLGLYALSRKTRVRDLAAVAAISVVALLLSSVQTLPMVDHFGDSARARGIDFREVSDWSTPPARLVELLYPERFGWTPESRDRSGGEELYADRGGAPFFQSIYVGLLPVAMCVAGVAARVRGWRLYLACAAASVILALGRHTPLLELLHDAGLARSIRYPEKFLILGIFATVVFAAVAVDACLREKERVRRYAAIFAGTVAAIALFAWLPFALARGAALAAILLVAARLPRTVAVAMVGAFVVGDLAPRVAGTAPRASRAFYAEPPPVLTRFAPDVDEYRIIHFGNLAPTGRVLAYEHMTHRRDALAGYSAATYGIRSALDIDYDVTGLAHTHDFDRAAWQLSERLPGRYLNYITAMANVRYILQYRDYKQAVEEARRTGRRIDPVRVVEGPRNPRYYFASSLATAASGRAFVDQIASGLYDPRTAFVADPARFQPAPGRVLRVAEGANAARLEVEAEGDAFLVMSVTAHKYWTVTIDGMETPPIATNLAFQGVVVPRGRHVVEMRYHNPLIAAGAAVSLATLAALLFAGWRSRRAITMRDL